MSLQDARAELSPEEELAAEESLTLYCRPVELYNITQRRAIKNPLFLQRNLLYKIHARQKKRIELTISLSGSANTKVQEQNIFPLYVLLARPTINTSLEGHTPIYRFSRVCLLTSFSELGNKDNSEATFIIPDVKNLSTSQACNLSILLISCGQDGQTICEVNSSPNDVTSSSLYKLQGQCSWGKIQSDLLASSFANCVGLSLGDTVDFLSTVTMSPSFFEPKFLEQDSCLTFCSHKVDATGSYQLQICISAQEAGAREMIESRYISFSSYDNVPSFIITKHLKLLKNFLARFAWYGDGFHLNSTHDLFSFEFVITKQNQIVNVSLKDDVWRTELVVAEGVHPRHQIFSYCSRSKRCRQLVTTTEKLGHVQSHIMESGSSEDDCVQKDNEHASAGLAHSAHGNKLSQPTVLQFDEQADLRNRQLSQKRQFFHSHRSQPMALEQVFSEHDSEDDVDEDIADYDNRRMLDDYVGVSKDEKQIMHMWNSFVKKQRVLADRHVPWACEAFSRLHEQQLVQNTALLWCWRFFMIKLWNHNLLDARTMNTCNIILQGFQDGSSRAK